MRILLVEPDAERRTRQAVALSAAGHAVKGAATFEEARRELVDHPPDALITAVRLGAFNGLHLIIRARAAQPHLIAVLTAAAPDPALETEAAALWAVLLTEPDDVERLVAVMKSVPVEPPG